MFEFCATFPIKTKSDRATIGLGYAIICCCRMPLCSKLLQALIPDTTDENCMKLPQEMCAEQIRLFFTFRFTSIFI